MMRLELMISGGRISTDPMAQIFCKSEEMRPYAFI